MERLLKAQKLAIKDVGRGVTIDMVKKNMEAHRSRKEEHGIVHVPNRTSAADRLVNEMIHEVSSEALRHQAVDTLLTTIEETEALEDQLRAKYNL